MKHTIKTERTHPKARLPTYAHSGPLGDLAADLAAVESVSMGTGETKTIRTGLALEFPTKESKPITSGDGLDRHPGRSRLSAVTPLTHAWANK